MKKMTELTLFKGLVAVRPSVADDMRAASVNETVRVPASMIDEPLSIIRRRFKLGSASHVLSDLDSGNVIPIFQDVTHVPSYIPAWLVEGPRSIVNLSLYATRSKDDPKSLTIDSKRLFGMLQTGSTILRVFNHQNQVGTNATLAKNLSLCYCAMISKVVDRAYALNLDPLSSDMFRFHASRFFLMNHLGREDSKTVTDIAFANTRNSTSRMMIEKQLDENPVSTESPEEFIDGIAAAINPLRNITTKEVISGWVRTYGDSTLFGFESGPYFVASLFSTIAGSFLANDAAVLALVADPATKAYNEFFRIVR